MKAILLVMFGSMLNVCIDAQNCLITNVTIVDTQNGSLVREQDVLIQNGQITKIGDNLAIIEGIPIVSGDGKYLMPGLADAHIHFFQSGGLYTRPDAVDLRHKVSYEQEKAFGLANAADYLQRYLRLGITTVIDVGGPMTNFLIRDSIAKEKVSPNVLVTGPLFSSIDVPQLGDRNPPIVKITNISEADALLDQMLPMKPDLIKIWGITTPDFSAEQSFDLIKHIADRTHAEGLKLTVHATELEMAILAVRAGADILVHSVGDEEIPDDVIQDWKEKNITYIPTLVVSAGYYNAFSGQLPHHPQDLAWANPFAYGTLYDPEGMSDTEMPSVLKRYRASRIPLSEFSVDLIWNANLIKLTRAGINIATGTDAGNIGTMHASSYLQELEAMQKAGLSNAEILKASTINVARGFGKDHLWGSIEEGKVADLILLKENPLNALQHLNSIEFVLKDGKMLPVDFILEESPEAIVQRQLNAYNARNTDAFLDTYAEEIEIFELHGKQILQGKEEVRATYADFFEKTNNLYCKIENRIINNNIIIDQENVRAGDRTIEAVAIYEVEQGKIRRVTFVR